MNKVSQNFGKAERVNFLLPKLLPNGSSQQMSISFTFELKQDAEVCVINLHEYYSSGQLGLNVYQKENIIELSFIDNKTIEEKYIGKFSYRKDDFEAFKHEANRNPHIYLLVGFFDGTKDVFVFPSSDFLKGMYVLAGFNCIT